MRIPSRRDLLHTAGTVAAALPAAWAATAADQISLAQWSLNRSFFLHHRWTNLDFPRIAREQFGIGAVEFVDQFFERPSIRYLNELKRAGEQVGVKYVRIMIDEEGDMAAVDRKERMDSAIAHRKWIDTAHYLGCADIRCNMRGGLKDWKQDKDLVKRAAESFHDLVEYARGSGMNVCIENHGGASSDPEVLLGVIKQVGSPNFGVLPDFGNINEGDDRAEIIRKIVPYAKGISVKGIFDEQGKEVFESTPLIRICQEAGFHGYWGIESAFGFPRGARPNPAEQRKKMAAMPAEELWQNELKGVRLMKEILDRTVFKA